ncbi:hypothetical protein PROFUN_15461 [Planoprotostelium fungivorum]|uniref:Uncharacterized protein n=1 Tax=Planoprotostelium fungivorum TaxID=1890364 RepID=A0A2P6MW26_9EUKA|nr:hypothetical protein PROFUN_15461 [Planoprotostelium fungivorum]
MYRVFFQQERIKRPDYPLVFGRLARRMSKSDPFCCVAMFLGMCLK